MRWLLLCFLLSGTLNSLAGHSTKVKISDSPKSLKDTLPASITDSVFTLIEIEVGSKTALMPYIEGWIAEETEVAAFRGRRLSETLQRSGLLVRAYSPGGLATPSSRGGASRHTALLWNGVNLQSPLNGTIDLSLFPMEFIDFLSYHDNGISSLRGSGSFGGSINLGSTPSFQTGWSAALGLSVGSFGFFRPFGEIGYGSNRYQASGKAMWSQSRNDFKTENGERRENAARQEYLLSHEQRFVINARNQLKSWVWWQQADREIPPSSISASRNEYQKDSILRLGLEWMNTGENRVDKLRFFRLEEKTDYGSDVTPASLNEGVSWVANYQSEHYFGLRSKWVGGLNFRENRVLGDAIGRKSQTLADVWFAMDHWLSSLWNLDVGMRLPSADWQFYVPAGHLGIGYQPSKSCLVKIGAAYNFTLPSLNDLYWSDNFARGNENLLPERSIDLELGLVYKRQLFQLKPRLYFRHVYDWIQWFPQGAGGVWSPDNLQSVRSVGGDLPLEWERSWSNAIRTTTVLFLNFNYTRELGNELRHIAQLPAFRFNFLMRLDYKKWSLEYSDQLIGNRYSTPNASANDLLPSQYLASLELSLNTKSFECYFRLENIWNTAVELYPYYPIPGIHWRAGAVYRLGKENSRM
ncbi:MAG: TonB-dependent receptor [Bacteroidetes bacterium]|nr:TonB-dependent receptor [Bacteroidota bacterium]